MNCEQAQDLLSVSLDEPLGAPQQAAVDEHLAGCPACAERMVQQVLTLEILHGIGRIEASETPAPLPESVLRRVLEARAREAGTEQRRKAL
jgi:predicted anti-sigma-YlaC factor YlaD